jgi:hypothetical protein
VIGLLETIVSGVEALGDLIVSGMIGVINIFFGALQTLMEGLLLLLPKMPEVIKGSSIAGLAWFNWVFPVGTVVGMFGTIITMFVAYLALRWILNMVKA